MAFDLELEQSIEAWLIRDLGNDLDPDFSFLQQLLTDSSVFETNKLKMHSKEFKVFEKSIEGLFCRIAYNYKFNKISRVINDVKILVDNMIDLEYIVKRLCYLNNDKVYHNFLINYVKEQ